MCNKSNVPEDPNVLGFNSTGRSLLSLDDDTPSVIALQTLAERL
jgi:hypothetical protein